MTDFDVFSIISIGGTIGNVLIFDDYLMTRFKCVSHLSAQMELQNVLGCRLRPRDVEPFCANFLCIKSRAIQSISRSPPTTWKGLNGACC